MIHWQPLSKGSKNPPLNVEILLKAIDGTKGVGVAFKYKNCIHFNYNSHGLNQPRSWTGANKNEFKAWAVFND